MFNLKNKNKQTSELKIEDVAAFIVEDFNFRRYYVSAVDKLEDRRKYESAYNFHKNKIDELIEKFNLKVVVFDEKEYDEGLPVKPLNIDEFEKNDILQIEQTIEPTILDTSGNIIRYGTVILSKKTKEPEIVNETENQNYEILQQIYNKENK